MGWIFWVFTWKDGLLEGPKLSLRLAWAIGAVKGENTY
jgi:hypothetical protein